MTIKGMVLPCGHRRSYKCGAHNVYCCDDCHKYFRADEEIVYPEEMPRMHEVQPIWVNPSDHNLGWSDFTA